LVAVTGEDHGKDVAAWSQWLEEEGEPLQPVPWSEPTEPVQTWWQTILVPRERVTEPRVQVHTYKPGHQAFLNV